MITISVDEFNPPESCILVDGGSKHCSGGETVD